MKISIGSDHGAYNEKAAIVKHLEALGYEVKDYGTHSADSVDYPDYIKPVANDVSSNVADFGIVLCGTGIGASIVANKVRGIRCALVYDPEVAITTRLHNNSNVLALGGRITPIDVMLKIVDNWLNTEYSNEERHNNRITKIKEVEYENQR